MKPEKYTPNVNSGITGDVYIVLRDSLNRPTIIHIHIFVTENKKLTFQSCVMLVWSRVYYNSNYEGKEELWITRALKKNQTHKLLPETYGKIWQEWGLPSNDLATHVYVEVQALKKGQKPAARSQGTTRADREPISFKV